MTADDLNVYELLAKKFDEMPPGFPPTEDGLLETSLLRWMFTQEEAEVALGVSPEPETAEVIAERLRRPVSEVETILDTMGSHGCVKHTMIDGQAHYSVMAFLPGTQEPQFWRQDKTSEEKRKFTAMWDEYYQTFVKIGSYGPAFARIVPVNEAVEGGSISRTLDDVHALVDQAKAILQTPCVCREEKRILDGSNCDHSSQVCLLVSRMEGNLPRALLHVGKVITNEEAHQILDKCAAEGLIHETFNADDAPFYFICNCCSCCCVVLRAAKKFNVPGMVASDFVASISQTDCTACGICADERCQMDAIEEVDGEYRVIPERCIGCGVCAIECPTEAIRLTRKAEADAPPASMQEWAMQRMANRPDKT